MTDNRLATVADEYTSSIMQIKNRPSEMRYHRNKTEIILTQ